MTTSLISQVSPVKTDSLVSSAKAGAKANDSTFQDMLSTSAQSQNNKTEVKAENSNASKKAEDVNKASGAKKTDTTKKSKEVDSINTSKNAEDVPKEVAEAIQSQITEAVAKELNVTPEELLDALNELGLEPIDLLDNTVIPAVVAKVNGAENMLAIATDENLYETVVEVSELVNDIKGDIDITDEKYDSFINKVKEASAESGAEVTGTQINIDEDLKNDKGESNAQSEGQFGNQPGSLANQILDNIREAVETRNETTTSYANNVEEIYNQIEQSLKVNLTKEVTELEINLHPASLGNVKINLASKDGMVTANFITQNDAVRAAVEAQLIELKESFEEQGIKVDAIEVMVASHAFDENLSQNGETNADDYNAPKRRRSINLNDLTEDAELELTDEIELAREMMMANGNSVDYMA